MQQLCVLLSYSCLIWQNNKHYVKTVHPFVINQMIMHICEHWEQVWDTVELFHVYPRLETEQPAKTGVFTWAWLHFHSSFNACIPYVVFFSHLLKKEPVQYHRDRQGMPSQLCCIRRTVSEKWDVKCLSTALVNTHSAFAWHKNTLCPMQLITIPAHHWIKAKINK